MEIITDYKWKNFKDRSEIPELILEEEFNWLTEHECNGFICYKKEWYHLSEFLSTCKNKGFPDNWQGYSSDSFFSGIVIEISNDGEMYRIGTYISRICIS